MNKKLMKKAFTLVEMLIVVVIIGILIAALLPKFKGAQKSAKDATRLTASSQIMTALGQYYAANNAYPASATDDFCTTSLQGTLGTFMSEMPKEPSGTLSYGTKAAGCSLDNGYTYSALKNNSIANGAALVAAALEVPGKKANAMIRNTAAVLNSGLDIASTLTGLTNISNNFVNCTFSGGVSVATAASPAACQDTATGTGSHYMVISGVN